MFYQVFVDLCHQKGISESKAAESVGLNRASVSKWKAGAIPNGATLSKLADYFGVSADYLLNGGRVPAAEAGGLSRVYFSLAKKMEAEGIHPEDVQYFIDLQKRARERHDKS